MRVEGKNIDLRVSTLPTQYGERVVMRILDRSTASMSLDELGFSAHNLLAFNSLIRKPHGIILVTGPTGSGKTTTLYAALNALRSPTTNIITCEDPVEPGPRHCPGRRDTRCRDCRNRVPGGADRPLGAVYAALQ